MSSMQEILRMGTESYELGWSDCRKREVEPLKEQNAKLLAAAKAALHLTTGGYVGLLSRKDADKEVELKLRQAIKQAEEGL